MEFEAALTHFLNYFNVHFIGQRKIQLKIMKLLEKVKKKNRKSLRPPASKFYYIFST